MIIKTIQDYKNLCNQYVSHGQYVFRGQSNEKWSPLPTAYRICSNVKCPSIEKAFVDRFIRHLQENGYHNFSCELNQFDFLTKPTEIFPTEEMLPYWAIAQHYAFDSYIPGVKTSLLDVTHNLDIAAYFAVEENTKEEANGKIFIFDTSTRKDPYNYYEPLGDSRIEARLVIQDCAFIYRVQTCEHASEHEPYKNKESFDDIVIDTITISKELKPQLKEHLRNKLFELFMYPRLILRQVTPSLATAGQHSFEELKEINKPAVDRAEKLGDIHSDY